MFVASLSRDEGLNMTGKGGPSPVERASEDEHDALRKTQEPINEADKASHEWER